MSPLLSKPLLGGPFGAGQYALASVPAVRGGLHAARFLVVDTSGRVLAVEDDKGAAIANARRVLEAHREIGAANDPAPTQGELFARVLPVAMAPSVRPVSRRRREIFERGAGRCHYCSCTLQLDGKWHVEHQLPRALGGTDDAVNLVPACVPCNLRKSDRTAVEFMATEGDRHGG